MSNNNGQTFDTPIILHNTTDITSSPAIATEGNNVYVTWNDGSTSTTGITNIFLVVSNNNGQTFSAPINLSNVTNNSINTLNSEITTSDNNVYVLWEGDRAGQNQDIFFTASNNNGQTFSNPMNISKSGGVTFSSDGSVPTEERSIVTQGNNVYIIWKHEISGIFDIFFAVSNNNGQTFSNPINVSNNIGNSNDPKIDIKGNNVYIIWRDNTSSNYEILFAVSNNNGQTFTAPINLSNNIGFSENPNIALRQ